MKMMFDLLVVAALAIPVVLLAALVMLVALHRRVKDLETEMTAVKNTIAAVPEPVPPPISPAVSVPEPESLETADRAVAPVETPHSPPISEPIPPETELPPPLPRSATPPPLPLQKAAPPPIDTQRPEDNVGTSLPSRLWNWFITGNVPVKVGMLVLLAGVAALLKYAGDQGWLRLPIQLRLAGISLAALAGLVIGWRKRMTNRAFALAVQGGSIGILLLVVFAAVKLYALLNPAFAFALSALLIAGGAVLAVMQNARMLAVFSVLAGFMAPIWLSDGSGNHVALFSWYALLNAGIFAIAWVRPWRSLNLIGFVFTWGIGIVWGVLQYNPDKFATTQPFLALFFVFYLLLPILYARKEQSTGSARVDAGLLFGTPLIAFSLQAGLLDGERLPLALCALGVAALYALLGWQLMGRERLHRLAQGYAILAVGFATLAVPLGLSGKVTAAVFALEGAGLVWLGWVQQRKLARIGGLALQGLAALFWLNAAAPVTRENAETFVLIANADFMGGLMIALGGFAIAWLSRQHARTSHLALGAYLWALVWWLGSWGREILEYGQAYWFVHDAMWRHESHAFVVLFALTGWLAAEVQKKHAARALVSTVLGIMPCAGYLAIVQHFDMRHPFAHAGVVAWGLFALLGARSLWILRPGAATLARLTQLAWWLLGLMVLSMEAWYFSGRWRMANGWLPSTSWQELALVLPWLAAAGISLYRWRWAALPLGRAFDPFRAMFQSIVLGVLGLIWLGWLSNSGASAPLPWVPVLNPVDLAQIGIVLLAGEWLRQRAIPAGTRWSVLAIAAWLLLSVMTLRAVHHWGGVPWMGVSGSSLAQSSLTLVWSVLGVLGWILGSRRGQWGVWLGGAVLMGVVLLKLILIDRSNLGNLTGIGAVIAYGLLCTLTGWLAPMPPRRISRAEQGTSA